MFEHDLRKLDLLWQRGRESYRGHQRALEELLL
jgi:hypothetical protein